MYIYKTPIVVIYLKLLCLYITSTNALPLSQTNNSNINIPNSKTVTTNNVPNVVSDGGGKVVPALTNVTIIPGPNIDGAVSDYKSQRTATVNTSSSRDQRVPGNHSNVASEGGGIIGTNQPLNKNDPLVPAAVDHNAETTPHKISLATNSNMPSSGNTADENKVNFAMEGEGAPELVKGPVAHDISSSAKLPEVTVPKGSDSGAMITPHRTIPISETVESSHQEIVPRKGVDNKEFSELESSLKPVIKKPLVTEASEDELSSEVHSEVNSNMNSTVLVESNSKVPSLDRFNEFSNNTQQYVIPIVIVILSVPLVTIVISFLLKRGAEWWKYRHYKRMDFLINGIYET